MRRFALLLLLLVSATCAFAEPVEFTFISWNDGNWQNGYPYVIEPMGGGVPAVLFVMCDDYVHAGAPGQVWDANITRLGDNNITLTRFNKTPPGPTALTPLMLYDEAGWILLQTLTNGPSNYQAMNYAVWNIFDPNAPCNQSCEFWLNAAQMAAEHHFPDSDFNRVYIITPVDQYNPDPNSPQEFLALGTDSGLIRGASETVPEPGSLLLMGSGLAAFVGRKFFS